MNKKQLEAKVDYLSKQQALLMSALNHTVSGRLDASECVPAEGLIGGLIHLKLYDAIGQSIVVQIHEASEDNPLLTSTVAFYLEERIKQLRLFDATRPAYSEALRRLRAKRDEIADAAAERAKKITSAP